jgi:PIN domain nuclease of toxin-antitoxin system
MMNLLLDTHVLMWWADGQRIGSDATAAIASPDNAVFVSAVSIWEAEIKIAIQKLRLDFDLESASLEHGFEPLAITFAHASTAGRLPLHHRDPWDRMLVAQAQLEGLTLVSRDPAFRPYRVPLLAA